MLSHLTCLSVCSLIINANCWSLPGQHIQGILQRYSADQLLGICLLELNYSGSSANFISWTLAEIGENVPFSQVGVWVRHLHMPFLWIWFQSLKWGERNPSPFPIRKLSILFRNASWPRNLIFSSFSIWSFIASFRLGELLCSVV